VAPPSCLDSKAPCVRRACPVYLNGPFPGAFAKPQVDSPGARIHNPPVCGKGGRARSWCRPRRRRQGSLAARSSPASLATRGRRAMCRRDRVDVGTSIFRRARPARQLRQWAFAARRARSPKAKPALCWRCFRIRRASERLSVEVFAARWGGRIAQFQPQKRGRGSGPAFRRPNASFRHALSSARSRRRTELAGARARNMRSESCAGSGLRPGSAPFPRASRCRCLKESR